MIKFFRHLRLKFIAEKNFQRYILYAIGEIILVVIGILIALQINNWNENRKAYHQSRSYLSEILKDLEVDTLAINSSIGFTQKHLKVEKWVLNRTDYDVKDADSLWLSLGGFYATIPLNKRTFQKMQNAGDSKLQGFDDLYDKIVTYYTRVHDRYQAHFNWDVKSILEGQKYMQELDTKLEMSNDRMEFLGSETTIDSFPQVQDANDQLQLLIDFAKSPRGRNHFKYNFIRHSRGMTQFNEVKAKAIILMNEIKEALKNAK